MHTQNSYRILLFNLGYCTGLEGSLAEYLLRSWHYLYTPRSVLRAVQDGLRTILDEQRPDLCCFLELHHDKGLLSLLRSYRCRRMETKYGLHSLLRRIPLFRDNCNGVFAKSAVPFRKHYFQSGVKKLVYEVALSESVSLFLAHFSLHHGVRERQFAELAAIVRTREEAIVCGDFNDFGGTRELRPLLRGTDLRIVRAAEPATFPACHPRRLLDLFLCTPGVAGVRAQVLSHEHLSDHLPVLLDVELGTR